MEIKNTIKFILYNINFCIELVADVSNKGVFTPDRKLQCYFKCMMMNTKVVSKISAIV